VDNADVSLTASACSAGDIACNAAHGTVVGTAGSCSCSCDAGYEGADCSTGIALFSCFSSHSTLTNATMYSKHMCDIAASVCTAASAPVNFPLRCKYHTDYEGKGCAGCSIQKPTGSCSSFCGAGDCDSDCTWDAGTSTCTGAPTATEYACPVVSSQ
jgi:hypothetical protein